MQISILVKTDQTSIEIQWLDFAFCQVQKLIVTCLNKEQPMLPSPSSSLSSFRDLYQHTSEYSEEVPTSEQFINQGITNFKITKVFTKINWKINQQRYWALFYAFKKLMKDTKRREMRKKAMDHLAKILNRRNSQKSKIMVQCNYLHELMENMKDQRARQLSKMMAFGLKFMKKNYINAAICYHKVMNSLLEKGKLDSNEVPQQKRKYLLKLSRAILRIVVRNAIDKQMFKHFRQIKHGYILKTKANRNQITFFKPKKEKVYEHRREGTQTQKLLKIIALTQLFEKKRCMYFKSFLYNIKSVQAGPCVPSLSDNSQIATNLVQHMIYLTGKVRKHQQKLSKSNHEAIRAFKLQQLLKKDARRGKRTMRESLLQWRRVTNEQNLLLRRQILKLQMIKKYYMDEV